MKEKNIIETIKEMNIKYKHPETLQMERYFDDKCPGCGEGSDTEDEYMKVGDKCGMCDYALKKDGVEKFEKLRKELFILDKEKNEKALKNKQDESDQELASMNKGVCPRCTDFKFSVKTACNNCGFEASAEQKNSIL